MKLKKYFVIALFILIIILFFMNIKEGLVDISGNDISENYISQFESKNLYDLTGSSNSDKNTCYKTKNGTGLKINNAKNIRDILQYSEYDTDSTDKLTLLQDIAIPKTEDPNVYQLIHNSNKTPDERIHILNKITNGYETCYS